MAITIKDIAKETGFSLATISFVLNDKKTGISISEATKAKVKEAAERLGYQPNYQAQALRRQKSDTIGVVFGTDYRYLNDPVVAEILSGVGAALDPTDYEMHLLASYQDITERSLQAARGKKVDGLIFVLYSSTFEFFKNEVAPQLQREGIPYAGVQFYARMAAPGCVGVNVTAGTEKAVAHLAAAGCRTVDLVLDSKKTSIAGQEVAQSFEASIQQASITGACIYLTGAGETDVDRTRRYRAGADLAERMVKEGTLKDGYFFFSDIVAHAFIETLREKNVDIPGAVKVVGFGNILNGRQGSEYLTTVDGCYTRSGQAAAENLMVMLEKKRSVADVVLEPELIIRKST